MRSALMIDCETLSLKHNAAILTIGAVVFDPYGNNTVSELMSARNSLYLEVSLDGQDKLYGRDFDADTILWWMEQPEESRMRAFHGKADMSLPGALQALTFWAVATSGCLAENLEVWSKGIANDYVWLENATHALHLNWPFRYRNARCLRTLQEISGIQPFDVSGLTKHHAQHDAIYQVLLAQQIMNFIKEGVTNEKSLAKAG